MTNEPDGNFVVSMNIGSDGKLVSQFEWKNKNHVSDHGSSHLHRPHPLVVWVLTVWTLTPPPLAPMHCSRRGRSRPPQKPKCSPQSMFVVFK